ncbi:hypothetical protein BBJ28_00025868, partial [Nothophytophthora sp. Chile5]
MYKEFRVDFTHPQALKVLHGKPVRLSADQLGKGHPHYFHPENHKKLVKAYESHKGLTLYMAHGEVLRTHMSGLSGSGFWGNLWNGVKKGAKFLKDSGILSTLANTAVPAIATAVGAPELAVPARAGLKALTGVGMEQEEPIYSALGGVARRHHRRDTTGGRLALKDVRKGASKAYGYAKKKGIVSDAVDAVESHLLSKASKPEHVEMIRS